MIATHRPLSSSFLWFIFRILSGNPKKELLRGLWVLLNPSAGYRVQLRLGSLFRPAWSIRGLGFRVWGLGIKIFIGS